MLKEWQFNVLFFVGVGGALFMLIAPSIGIDISKNPVAVSGVGAILTYVLTQKKALVHKNDDQKKPRQKEGEDGPP